MLGHVIGAHRFPAQRVFFTRNTYRREALLAYAEALTALRAAYRAVRTTHPFRVEAMAILPDHLHAVWGLTARLSLLKRHVAHRVRHLLAASQSASRDERRELALWQRRFWERQVRDDADFSRHVDNIHYNPVKHGLVVEIRVWPCSTFHHYVRLGLYPQSWAGAELPRTEGDYGEPGE